MNDGKKTAQELEIFLNRISAILQKDERILALCIGGSWLYREIDRYSDLDLVLITRENISDDKDKMLAIASGLGDLLIGFTGEHVGEKRLLICLYDNPLIHVDLKFLQTDEFAHRVENPEILWERNEVVSKLYKKTVASWPATDFQWIEDRFWVWIHYAATKLGRGELIETIAFLSFLHSNVICPLFAIKYNTTPRGTRKIEFILNPEDLEKMKRTLPDYSFDSIKSALLAIADVYKELRGILFDPSIKLIKNAEIASMRYLESIKKIYP